ncbi:MAG: DEAD/DEAH box helicase [Bacilli bacterium]
MNFNELGLKKEVVKVIEELGYASPTTIQERIIPLILEGHDIFGQSQTGTGKTLAFAATLLSKIETSGVTQALVLAPTRELAIQIEREIEGLGKYLPVKITCVYGSSSIEDQIHKLKRGVDIVVGTPGRVVDLIKRKVLKLENVKDFILDEADEMLSMGFKEDLEFIFNSCKDKKQVLLFSATLPITIKSIIKNYMSSDYQTVSVVSDVKTAENIKQIYYLISEKTKLEAMCRVMDYYNPSKAIIFCKTKRNADELLEKLSSKGYSVDLIHGDITQAARIATLDRFKNGTFNYLLATDVAARGIHVEDIEIVINYNVPGDNDSYVHRIGRTGRAKKSGMAITLVNKKEEFIIRGLERHINAAIKKESIPTYDDIIPNRKEAILETIISLSNNKNSGKVFDEYLNGISDFELKNICSNLLTEKLFESFGSNFGVDVSCNDSGTSNSRDNRRRTVTSEETRVFLTIGKIDRIERKDLLNFLENKGNFPQGTFTNVEIMTKFTFLNVKNKYLEAFVNKCNNTKLNNRMIRIEKAKK